jgi:hypothetical protein
VAASLVLGVAAALRPAPPRRSTSTTAARCWRPPPLVAPGNFAFIGTCPELPRTRASTSGFYALPEDVAVEGAAVRITATDVSGDPFHLTAAVFTDDCGFDRYEFSTSPRPGGLPARCGGPVPRCGLRPGRGH